MILYMMGGPCKSLYSKGGQYRILYSMGEPFKSMYRNGGTCWMLYSVGGLCQSVLSGTAIQDSVQ